MESPKLESYINNYYDNLTYYQVHEYDIWIVIIIIFLTLSITSYFLFINFLKSQKNNYDQNKCNPLFMPFVSLIKNDTFDQEFVMQNMKSCLDKLSFDVGINFKSPIDYSIGILKGIFYTIITLTLTLLNFILYIFSIILKIILLAFSRFELLLMESNIGFISILEFTNKLLAMLTTAFYTLILAIDMVRYSFQIMALAVLGSLVLPSIIAFVSSLLIVIVTFIIGKLYSLMTALFGVQAASYFPIFIVGPALAQPFAILSAIYGVFTGTMFTLWAGFVITMLIAFALMIFIIFLYAQFNDGARRMIEAMNTLDNRNLE